jgi:hypothetical protein
MLAGLAGTPLVGAEVVYVNGQRVVLPAKTEVSQDTREFWYVLGLGQTEKEATADALERARDVVDDFLQKQDPPLEWRPSAVYIQKHLMPGPAKRMQEFDTKIVAGTQPMTRKWYAVPIRITNAELEAMRRVELQQRATGRMFSLGKVVAFLVLGCVLVIGFLRLEEKTKGYLSRVLGFSLAGLLILLAVLLFIW